jgi:glyoxylase-like metal-dependent hydrolase (beta-lactamase superfamily II)
MTGRPLEILEDLYFIERGYLCANHFALRSPAPVLIDTGYKASWSRTRSLLEGLGIDLSAVVRIINTHTHCDHIGGNHAVQSLSGCRIALHPTGKGFMDTRDARSPWWSYYHQEADFFEAAETLEDGARVCVGPHEFEIIHTPGHAADGLVLYNRRERLLISSDTLWERDIPVMTPQIEGDRSVATMLASLEKISRLAVDQVYPGHGLPFGDFPTALRRAQGRLEGYLKEPARIGWDLVKKIAIYTLMMKARIPVGQFFDLLMQTAWYPETVEAYLEGDYHAVFERLVTSLSARGLIRQHQDHWVTTVKP